LTPSGGKFVTITDLFVKRAHGKVMERVSGLDFGPEGIANGVRCSPLRQVLITSRSVTRECGLAPADLRENIMVDMDGFYDLPSGTVVKIGQALVRLTFHCEPCKKILHLIAFDRILHKRGYLGCFLNSGTIVVGDAVAVTEQQFEPIPYAVKDRIRWFLSKGNASLGARDLAHALGLPSSYVRALPRLAESLASVYRLAK
jgi:MOSC domain-containing protein YiiM